MIDDYLLEALVAFAKYGTLSATAEHLMVTQPTVTRGMQKLEDELGVTLFKRTPNRISLTETGQLAAKEAEKLLEAKQAFIEHIQDFEKHSGKIRLGSVAPGPLYIAEDVASEHISIDNDLLSENEVIAKLLSQDYQLIFTHQEIQTDDIESLYVGTESLRVNSDAMVVPANKTEITFQEMAGFSFVVLRDIGIWQQIIEDNIPNAKFIYQDEVDDFNEIRRYSSLPYFTTNITQLTRERQVHNRRLEMPITDETAQIDFYLAYLKTNKSQFKEEIAAIQTAWANLK
ncbi:LysR family transcriptional regulator [Streptococcus gallolyticus]|uniref:LysR family transcriptional regulator n=1 Tax=Streptococcus gallolyticus TaxID=315405 RepID=UPI0001E0EC2B|nr:LysR family transcriptional regulator [Streptococcus gallolyticus]EFM30097.1 transcriptional regulator, LysR family [Streptococcus gallolyticus subsp. gallolyticus TX20005]MCF0233032.1 LysR family transcriptional regulator [Enterococcus sp.]QKI01401.1 LysR family transcriptional regulator [Streptococcus gallolyticus]QWX87472.1 LysR family transcriptional regulator [Streptococcus gallolyticus subsp. gallolyticus TX20005]